ncbi:MAG: hypothetical protein H6667_08975 [Ardenticatenaceae bacterium]|nr:hypothetical protein [Ardenticatenaceae bacterium]MCB9445221.1 hypothetical protein [Ardenticatenaceae bacterium]
MSTNRPLIIFLFGLLAAGLLAACGPMTTAIELAAATAVPTPSPITTFPDGVTQQTTKALAQTLGIDAAAVSIVSIEEHAWPDSCLGIQTPGMMCAQHVVDGYLVTLEANGQDFTYRTNGDGSSIAADQTTPTPTTTADACTLVANSDVTLYNRPDTNAGQFGVLSAGEKAIIGGQTAAGWLGFDPAVAQAANVGIFRLRWLAPGSDVTITGNCDTLPMYPSISPTACYEMAMADTPIYNQPVNTAVLIATLPAGEYTAVTGKTAQDWYQVDLSNGSLAVAHTGQTGWIAPDAGNFNGQSCANLPGVNP